MPLCAAGHKVWRARQLAQVFAIGVQQGRGTQPGGKAGRAGQRLCARRRAAAQRRRQSGQRLFRRWHGALGNQLVPGPREGHI